jgi:predicted SprT family Zn-dependent metalloprotease
MGTISDVQNLAIELMRAEYTIVTSKGTHTISPFKIGYCFGFNSRKRAFGLCRYNIKKVELSLPLCTENLDKIDTRIKNTILHEIAHALSVHVYGIREGRGHGPKWKSIAKQIGCDGNRCYDGDSVNKVKGKYSLVCDHCGYETPKHRKGSRLYACPKCCNEHNGGKFTEKYKLRLVVNNLVV